MKATTVTRTFIACPGCGSTSQFDVQHLLDRKRDTTFGPWGCHADGCRTEITGRIKASGEIAIETRAATPRGLALLKFRDLYMVKDEPYGRIDNPDFFYHSHQCPQNILRDVIGVYDPATGADPHGVLRFVASIEASAGVNERIRDTSTLEGLFVLFGTDGQPAPTEWPEENGGLLPVLAEARLARSRAGKA